MAKKRSKVSKQSKARERQQRLERLRDEQQRTERRRNLLIVGITVLVALAVVGGIVLGLTQSSDSASSSDAAGRLTNADVGIPGVLHANVADRHHVDGHGDYPETPPVGGDHSAVWQNCGFYDQPVDDDHGVHTLEHGAVWITYDKDLSGDQVSKLRQLAVPNSYILISPHDNLPSAVVASAWGYQLRMDSADDPRLQQFLERFVQGDQTPEPGAACTGGLGKPAFSE